MAEFHNRFKLCFHELVFVSLLRRWRSRREEAQMSILVWSSLILAFLNSSISCLRSGSWRASWSIRYCAYGVVSDRCGSIRLCLRHSNERLAWYLCRYYPTDSPSKRRLAGAHAWIQDCFLSSIEFPKPRNELLQTRRFPPLVCHWPSHSGINRPYLSNLPRRARLEAIIETGWNRHCEVGWWYRRSLSLSWCNNILFSRHFLRREQYPFTEAQSGVSSKTYHWINCNRFTSKPGSSWYLIVMDWWLRWESSTVTPSEHTPGTINKRNSSSKLNKLTNGNDNK